MTTDPKTLHTLLATLRSERGAHVRSTYNRSLPFAELLFDRWERGRELGFGEGASIYDSALVFGDVKVGANTWIGPNVILDGSAGPLVIGVFCSISAGVHIYSHDTVLWAVSGGAQGKRSGPVSIGNRCHIGAQSVIVPGVSIGDMCVVGANSFVNRSVPARTVVAGSPARPIGHVEGTGAQARVVITQKDAPANDSEDSHARAL